MNIYSDPSISMTFSSELTDVCKKLLNKKRLFWANFQGLGLDQEIDRIKNRLELSRPRQLVYHVTGNIQERHRCVCGKLTSWNKFKWLPYCSSKCAVSETQVARASTMLSKYGNVNIAKTDHFKSQSSATFLKKYGVNHPSKSPEIQSKKLVTNRQKYNADNHSQSHLSESTKQIITNKQLFETFAKGKTIAQVSRDLGLSYSGPIKIAEKFRISNIFVPASRSEYEVKIKELLDSYNISYIQNSKSIIPPWQIDFFLTDFNLGIEVGSLYFHCEASSSRGANYHYNKWNLCQEKGITLLQYFDDEVLNKFELIESKIKRLCGIKSSVIGARKIRIITDLDTQTERDFLNKHHLQGPNFNRNHVYAGYYNDQLVSVLAVKLKHNHAEIVRYATNTEYSYPGLFSKMLKKFINDNDFKGVVVSYSDNRHSNGQLYKSSGFRLHHISKPGYSYTKNFILREDRRLFQKHKLAAKFNLTQQDIDSKTEWQIMQLHGYDRLWDAGQSLWIMQL